MTIPTPLSQALFLTLYPALAHVRPSLAELSPGMAPTRVPADTTLFSENQPCRGFPLVLEGEVKVSRSSGDGRSLELYRVVPGELCLASSASLFRTQPLSAHGVTTKPTTLLMIPADIFKRWLEAPEFRNEVMGLFAERMADLTSLVDALAFHKLDRRLAAALLGHGQQLQISHQTLADELGTVREIVTRLLRRFEREGWVSLGREQIQIINGAALRELTAV
jgi:CRP/FNR family transcriptional regulator